MLPRNDPDRIQIAFDDHRLVANAGLFLPVTLANHLGLGELVDKHVDLGDAPGRANAGDKLLILVASALAGGDCIDDADVLRAGSTEGVLGCVVKAPSTLGTFLRSFSWGHVRQLDRVSREVLARAWAAGAGPGDDPLTIDLDSTICETYGLTKEGAGHHGYTGQRGYHPLLAVAADTGDVLMARLREGRANTARGAANFLRETVSRVRHAGATGPLTMRADSGFYNHAIVADCRQMQVRYSITVRQHPSLRNLIEAIPEEDWAPIPYWMEGAADVAETEYTPFGSEPDAVPVRLIVRRVKPTPGSQLALMADYSYHAFITDRDGDTVADVPGNWRLTIDATPRSRTPSAISSTAWGSTIYPRGASPPTPPGWPSRAWPTTWPAGPPASVWASRSSPPRPSGDASSPSPDGSPARPAASPCTFPNTGPGKTTSAAPWPDCAPCRYLPDHASGARPVTRDPPTAWRTRARSGFECLPRQFGPIISSSAATWGRQPPPDVAATPRTDPNPAESKPCRPFPSPLIPGLTSTTLSLRWIRA